MAFELDATDAIRGILRIAEFPDLVRRPIREIVRETSEQIATDARASISRQGPPRSQPLEPPARDSGALVSALTSRLMPSKKKGELAYTIAPTFYGFMLESGTRRMGGRAGRRPFMVPARDRHAADFVAKVEEAIEREATGASNR